MHRRHKFTVHFILQKKRSQGGGLLPPKNRKNGYYRRGAFHMLPKRSREERKKRADMESAPTILTFFKRSGGSKPPPYVIDIFFLFLLRVSRLFNKRIGRSPYPYFISPIRTSPICLSGFQYLISNQKESFDFSFASARSCIRRKTDNGDSFVRYL